ncbi:hypothetical protein ACJ5NV_14525 [Loktanella agnita]|uniref:hypothetical protein n=1 Tax=Loktanella agnita TaxID=287097 RepID=UPI0039870F19
MATTHTKSPTQISNFRKRFSIRTQNEVRKWLNRFFRGTHGSESRFWSAQLISYERNGMLQRANDVIWGMLNENKGLADSATAMGMCELLMVEKKYKHCLLTSIELTFLQGSGADPVNKEEMEEAGLIDMHEEFPFVGSSAFHTCQSRPHNLKWGWKNYVTPF